MKDAAEQATTDRKIDRLIVLLEGTSDDNPGLLHRMNAHEKILMGEQGRGGLVQRVDTMWRFHVWILCTASGGIGFFLKAALEMLIKP